MHISYWLQSHGQEEEDGGNQRQVGENFGIYKNCLILCMCNNYDYIKDDQSYQGDKQGIFTR